MAMKKVFGLTLAIILTMALMSAAGAEMIVKQIPVNYTVEDGLVVEAANCIISNSPDSKYLGNDISFDLSWVVRNETGKRIMLKMDGDSYAQVIDSAGNVIYQSKMLSYGSSVIEDGQTAFGGGAVLSGLRATIGEDVASFDDIASVNINVTYWEGNSVIPMDHYYRERQEISAVFSKSDNKITVTLPNETSDDLQDWGMELALYDTEGQLIDVVAGGYSVRITNSGEGGFVGTVDPSNTATIWMKENGIKIGEVRANAWKDAE